MKKTAKHKKSWQGMLAASGDEVHTRKAIDFAIAGLGNEIDKAVASIVAKGMNRELRRISGELFKRMPKELLHRIISKSLERYIITQIYEAVIEGVIRHFTRKSA